MKLKVVYRKVSDYIRYDLKEIVLPSSLPDPPHVVKRRKLTWHERFLVLKEASRLYAASWVRDIGPELRPNDYKKQGDAEPKKQAKETEKEPSVFEDLGGGETQRSKTTRIWQIPLTPKITASNYLHSLSSASLLCV
ncbi:hypothetical protein BRARA_C00242 [Brassica rapa]|uniref:Uncharacterized protein n=1 Tax=Brassica campestris TaxID=3711 RepID=A0A397ZR23_BRACM|nr:hypothetical protein BRARA_C00242 [Brassica rapa]